MRYLLLSCLFVALMACSTSTSEKVIGDESEKKARVTGDETARSASGAARKALEEDRSGLIYASSGSDDDAAAEEGTIESTTVTITVSTDALTFDDRPTNFDGIGVLLDERLAADPETSVIIETKGDVDYARILRVEEAARQAGAQEIDAPAPPQTPDAPATEETKEQKKEAGPEAPADQPSDDASKDAEEEK